MTGKLYGTLGPACANTDTLRALLRAGMRGVRLNLSHGPLPSVRRGWKACAAPRPRRAFPVTCSSTCRAPSCASARFSRR